MLRCFLFLEYPFEWLASHRCFGKMGIRQAFLSCVFLVLGKSSADPSLVVDLGLNINTDIVTKIKVLVCAGLLNRGDAPDGSVYLLYDNYDLEWLEDETGNSNPTTTSIDDFMSSCFSSPASTGYIRYNRTLQAAIVPNILTMASMLNAIPLQDDDDILLDPNDAPTLIFDALSEFAGFNALNATSYVYDLYGSETPTISIMDPGYDGSASILNPPLTGSPNPKLIDYIVKEKLFCFYFVKGCVRGTDEFDYWEYMLSDNSNQWPNPVPVYGYNDAIRLFGGDTFEAETDCNSLHNMGQIASDDCSNLAYFSREETITDTIPQNPTVAAEGEGSYDATQTYFTIVIGDGDNVGMVQKSRRDWMSERVNKCSDGATSTSTSSATDPCFPLVWSMSPQLLHLAPEWLQWYYNSSYTTARDYFVLPPSGDLYSYPGEMPADVQANFVKSTELDCILMNTSATVHWEWFGTWTRAINNFFPQYAKNGIVKGIFPVNVPFLFPMLEGDWGVDEYYHLLTSDDSENKVVLFRPKEWRGTTCGHFDCQSTQELAESINSYPLGTVASMYVTSDGGANIDDIYEMVAQLDSHVKLVNHETLVEMAMQRG